MESTNPYQAPTADISAIPVTEDYDQSSPLSPKGRFGRLSYLAWAIVTNIGVQFILSELFRGLMGPAGVPTTPTMWVVLIALGVVSAIPLILFGIRRLHDFDASGWWSVLFLVPLANFFLGLALLFRAGDEGPNRFGPPRHTRLWEKVVGYIAIGIIVLGVVGFLAALLIPQLTRG